MFVKVFFVLACLFGVNAMAVSEVSKGQWIYGVRIDSNQVAIEVRVNDIPIYSDPHRGQLNVEVACPESIIGGLNTLTLISKLPFESISSSKPIVEYDAGASVSAILFREKDNGQERSDLLEVKYLIDEKGRLTHISDYDVMTLNDSRKTSHVSGRIDIGSSAQKWSWEHGELISDNKEVFYSLMAEYAAIHSILKSKDIKKIREAYEIKAQDFAIAYNLDDVEAGHRKIATAEDALDKTLSLKDLFTEDMELEIYANGKLARIQDKLQRQPIIFLDYEARAVHIHKFGFFRDKSGRWLLAR